MIFDEEKLKEYLSSTEIERLKLMVKATEQMDFQDKMDAILKEEKENGNE